MVKIKYFTYKSDIEQTGVQSIRHSFVLDLNKGDLKNKEITKAKLIERAERNIHMNFDNAFDVDRSMGYAETVIRKVVETINELLNDKKE